MSERMDFYDLKNNFLWESEIESLIAFFGVLGFEKSWYIGESYFLALC